MKKVVLSVFVVFLFIGEIFGQNVSNEGTEFWTVFPTHVASGPSGTTLSSHASLSVFVTSKSTSEVTVSCRNYSETKIIPANTAVEFMVTWAEAYISQSNSGLPDEANQVLPNRGIHIKVADGKPKVSVYTHIYAGARSAASLILPFETLGQTYYSMNYKQSNQGNNFLTLVAVENNTDLILHKADGTTFPIALKNIGDVYEYMNGLEDLTGVYVETNPTTSSCKRFAMFSGSSAIAISCSGSQDPLYQQLYPTVSWGKNYGVVPFAGRKYILRILAQDDNTKISYNGQSYIVNKGQYIESAQLTESTFVTSDKLISVAQYSLTQDCSAANGGRNLVGDPEMVMLNPVEFNIKTVTLFSSTLQEITERYINVLILTSKTASFKVDGIVPTSPWVVLASNSLYSYNQIPVVGTSANSRFKSLTLTADDGFNVIVYGFGDHESYSYSGGTNLSSNNYLTVRDEAKNEESPNGCVGESIDFRINLSYQPDKITWNLDNEAPVVTSADPEIRVVNGKTLYAYTYPLKKNYPLPGEHKLTVVAHVPNNEVNCQSGDFETNYVFSIYSLPTAAFETQAKLCGLADVAFTDKSQSNSADFAITNWNWDFGDGTTPSSDQNPKHKYSKQGIYEVKLFVKAGTSCYSEVVSKQIQVFPAPNANFTSNDRTCINTDIFFIDNSTISKVIFPSSAILSWSWNFGDGTALSTEKNPSHQYTNPGTYIVSLLVTSAEGCVSVAFTKDVMVTDLPVADFTTPDVCLRDAFALFVNKSVDATGGTGNFTYEWNFGDAINASVGNLNTSTEKDGKHKYKDFGFYNVSLKITNANGCVTTKTKTFTVNGAVEKAGFTIQNENNLCSNKEVIINNTSTAFFGKITKIEVFKDFDRNPSDKETILNPPAEDIHLIYPVFGGNSELPYKIRLVAYSGTDCFEEVSKSISIKPAPILEFADIPAACQDDGSVIINQAKETSGIVGNGFYSGEGVSATGNFNPKNVNIGAHLITYTFTALNGCPTSISKTINVYKSPTADAGSTIYILAGGQATIPAVADGSGLIYKWSPSLGLDHFDVLNPVASPEKDTEYSLLVTTAEGCTVTVSVAVKVLQALVPPNSFTPNGDGVNEVWNIKYLDSYPNATVEVFNRNGGRVFFSSGYKVPFDGNFQNEPLPVGVYYYIINPKNGRKTVTGPLTIIR